MLHATTVGIVALIAVAFRKARVEREIRIAAQEVVWEATAVAMSAAR